MSKWILVALTFFATSARADTVDVFASSVFLNVYGVYTESIAVTFDLNTVTFQASNLVSSAEGPLGQFDRIAYSLSGIVDITNSTGTDFYQIIPGAMNEGPNYIDPPWGTVSSVHSYNSFGDLDLACRTNACADTFGGYSQSIFSNLIVTAENPINTPEMSTGASLAAGLFLSSAFILYNRRRKENLCRSGVGNYLWRAACANYWSF